MALKKCPRCDLNYILDGGELCTVCRREVRGERSEDDSVELCSECGENPALPGSEYCAQCLKEMSRRNLASEDEEPVTVDDPTLPIDDVSTMDEIVITDEEDSVSPFGDGEYASDEEEEDAEEAEDGELSLDRLREDEGSDDDDEDLLDS